MTNAHNSWKHYARNDIFFLLLLFIFSPLFFLLYLMFSERIKIYIVKNLDQYRNATNYQQFFRYSELHKTIPDELGQVR